MNPVKLASLLCSRLCHDVISSVGAINNGIEILAEETDQSIRQQTLDLIAFSASEASNRLQFYRLAFGTSSGGDVLSLAEAQRVVRAFFRNGKIDFQWADAGAVLGSPLRKGNINLLLNMILICKEALPRGGTLAVAVVEGEGFHRMTVAADGVGAGVDDELIRALSGELTVSELDARTAQACFAGLLAAAVGGRIHVAAPATGCIELSAEVPAAETN